MTVRVAAVPSSQGAPSSSSEFSPDGPGPSPGLACTCASQHQAGTYPGHARCSLAEQEAEAVPLNFPTK